MLKRAGLSLVEVNWRHPLGELDIVAREADELVIVEVRSARTGFAGGPLFTVGPDKQRRLARLAQAYIRQCRWQPTSVRFDVIGLTRVGFARWKADWVQRAFEVAG